MDALRVVQPPRPSVKVAVSYFLAMVQSYLVATSRPRAWALDINAVARIDLTRNERALFR